MSGRQRHDRATVAVACAFGIFVLMSGCGGPGENPEPTADSAAMFSVRSPAFDGGGTIPARYTCAGAGDVPPLRWEKPPNPAKAYAVIVDDPDAPGGTYTHWIVVDLPKTPRKVGGGVPATAHEAQNSAGTTGWTPPCPPKGDDAHRYRFTVYALKERTDLGDGASVADARAAVERLAVARGRLVGSYARAG